MTFFLVTDNIQIALKAMIGKDYIWKKDQGMNFYPISEGGGDFFIIIIITLLLSWD